MSQLDHRNAAARVFAKIDKHVVGLERPRDDFFGRLGIVREPKCCRGPRSCLLAGFFRENRYVTSAFGKKNAASKSRDAGTHDCYSTLHQNDLRAMSYRVI